MTDHADIVRNNLEEIASFPLGDGRSQHRARAALAALDALVAERDESRKEQKFWEKECQAMRQEVDDALQLTEQRRVAGKAILDERNAAEARVAELEAALQSIVQMHGERDYAYEEANGMVEIAESALAAPTKEDTDE